MLNIGGVDSPWLRRLDHLICEVDDIDFAVRLFVDRLGFPLAWPIGRFWPSGLTAGVALGGVNLEFIQPDENPPAVARIRTIVFEPVDVDLASRELSEVGVATVLREKMEPDPELLRLRGFSEQDAQTPQLICRNLLLEKPAPFDFFLCDYAQFLRDRLAPSAFSPIPSVSSITLGLPNPFAVWSELNRVWGLPVRNRGVDIQISESSNPIAEVIEIRTDRGPLDLEGWNAGFRFV